MKKILLFSLVFLFGISFSQTHQFIYELTIKKPTDTTNIKMVLDIDKDNVKFYDYDFLPLDSIRLSTGEILQTNSESDQLLIRNINSSENKTFYTHTYDYFEISSDDKFNWNLEDETKKDGEYLLQKATTNFGGRQWTAWFNTEIPFHEGPYKFRGLSGLIFEIYDSNDIFHYTLLGSRNLAKTYNTNSFLETHYGKKPIKVSLKQYQKVKLAYYTNIVEVLKEFAKKGGSIASDQKLETAEEISKKRKLLQASIKKYYMPLEIDKAIPYPSE